MNQLAEFFRKMCEHLIEVASLLKKAFKKAMRAAESRDTNSSVKRFLQFCRSKQLHTPHGLIKFEPTQRQITTAKMLTGGYNVIPKYDRNGGMTTIICAYCAYKMQTSPGIRIVLVNHNQRASENAVSIVRRFLTARTKRNSKRFILLENDSSIYGAGSSLPQGTNYNEVICQETQYIIPGTRQKLLHDLAQLDNNTATRVIMIEG